MRTYVCWIGRHQLDRGRVTTATVKARLKTQGPGRTKRIS